MTDASRARDQEVAALLAELEGVGGRVDENGSRVASASVRGTVGSTNVLDEQLSKGGRRMSSSTSTSRHRPLTSVSSSSSHGGASQNGSPLGTGFSTYTPMLEQGDGSGGARLPMPLGVRLAPLQPVGSEPTPSNSTSTNTAAMAAGIAPLKPAPPPARRGSGTRKTDSAVGANNNGNNSATAGTLPFRPFPALTGGRVMASLAKMPAPKEEINIHDHKKFVEQEARQKDSGKVAANAHPMHRPESGSPAESATRAAEVPQGELDGSATAYRTSNFLPLMCSRYLRPAGLTPPGRWGHTLTAVDETHLFTFGGVEQSGDESNLLCEFSVNTIAWEPAFVAKGSPPTPRQGHAACGFEGRYLIIYGGLTNKGNTLLNDIHMYDAYTQSWSCLWDGRQYSKHEPAARAGHSMVLCDDRLYVYGGRTLKPNGKEGTTLANADVYVFSLNSRRWKRRLTTNRSQKSKPAVTADKDEAPAEGGAVVMRRTELVEKSKLDRLQSGGPVNPVPRSHHAACVREDTMYIHGGAGGGAAVLTDTWAIHLPTGVWSCLHTGLGSDAVPREKHSLFACGEALLVVGGCTGGKGIGDRLATKFNNFVAVLPLSGQEVPCWVPVSMGNASIVAPSRKSFGAAFHGGFVYLFGGVSGAEPATNSLVRFLAADGYVSADARATTVANDEAMRGVMQKLRERVVVPFDLYAAAATMGATVTADSCVGFHRAVLHQRAPLFLEKLLACRSEPSTVGGMAAVSAGTRRRSSAAAGAGTGGAEALRGEADRDVVDALMQQMNQDQAGLTEASPNAGGTASAAAARPQVYYVLGNSRVQGLEPALTTEALSALADYLTWGGLKSEYRLLLEEVEDHAAVEEAKAAGEEADNVESGMGPQRERLTSTLKSLQAAAAAFQLAPLGDLCSALLAGSRRKVNAARKECSAALRADLLAMADPATAAGGGATLTVLFADPHTKQQTARTLHPSILMASSSFFADLLRPLFTGEKTAFQIGSVAAKVTLPAAASPAAAVNQLLTTSSKRAILVGPISVPTRAIAPLVQFLYSQQLRVPREASLDTLLGAHELGLAELQAFSESIVAREEVNYDTCCSFYYLARKYDAALLEEMCLLTAVAGYAEVKHSAGYLGLSADDRKSIDSVASELRSNTWLSAPEVVTELKNAEAYAARWNASAST